MPAAGMLPSDQELVYVRVEGFLLIVAIAVVDLRDFGPLLLSCLSSSWRVGLAPFVLFPVPCAVFLTHLYLQELES